MTLKTLLLGSAAAFAVVGGAQAADLSVAEPVESVKVCDYFGNKYWYIPGTDTCLAVGGKVTFDASIHALSGTVAQTATALPTGHSSNWDFKTSAGLTFTAKSITDVGVLAGFVGLQAAYDGQGTASTVTLDGAWLSLGFVKLGHFGSTFNPDGAFTDDYGLSLAGYKSALADNNKIELSWAAAGFGLALGIEDPRETWGTALPGTWSMPLITGKITTSQTAWSGLLSGGVTQLAAGTSWGVDGELTFNIGSTSKFRINGAYGDNAFIGNGLSTTSTAGVAPATNNGYSAFASFQNYFSSTFRGDVDVAYRKASGGTATLWQVAGDLVWLPYAGFKAKVGVMYAKPSTGAAAWTGRVSVRREW